MTVNWNNRQNGIIALNNDEDLINLKLIFEMHNHAEIIVLVVIGKY